MSSNVKVSVIIAVYNPGPYLDLPIGSLQRQTMPAGEWEAILVDDGSTDGSGERLDAIAAENPHIRAVHIPNSGWPGTPRNVALPMARGEHVLIMDHDDWLGSEALERMYDFAEATGADVVAAKEVGHGFGVPLLAFQRTIDDARLGRDPLLTLLTPHKLFRRSMLERAGIRFPEGKRRLEDHLFVVPAYFAARRIAVMADYPAYHWTRRSNDANASYTPVNAVAYYDAVRQILDIVDANTEPGPLRDTLYGHWFRYKTLHKLRGPRWTALSPTRGTEVRFDEIKRITEERFDPRLDSELPVGYRVLARAVRTGRMDLIRPHARLTGEITASVEVSDVSVAEGRIDAVLVCKLQTADGLPLTFEQRDGRLVWAPPPDLADPALRPEDLDASGILTESAALVVLRHRASGVEYNQQFALELASDAGVTKSVGRAHVRLDLTTFAAGGQLADGIWDAKVQVWIGGWRASTRLPADGLPKSDGRWWARPYANMGATASITVEGSPAAPLETPPKVDVPAGAVLRARSGWLADPAVRGVLRRYLPVGVREAARDILERMTGRPSGR